MPICKCIQNRKLVLIEKTTPYSFILLRQFLASLLRCKLSCALLDVEGDTKAPVGGHCRVRLWRPPFVLTSYSNLSLELYSAYKKQRCEKETVLLLLTYSLLL